MTREEWRRSPTGTVWQLIRMWKGPGLFTTATIRSEAGATRYISGDEWDDWEPVA
jgi:hypothetical protein